MSGGYAFLTFSLLGAGLGYIVAPYPTLMGVFGSSASQAGPENIILWQLIGAGVSMIVAPATLSLKVRTATAGACTVCTRRTTYSGSGCQLFLNCGSLRQHHATV